MDIYPTSLLPKQARWAAFVAYIGSFLQSYSISIIAGSLLFISEEFQLTPIDQGKVASSILLGAILGTIVSGKLADSLGRRPTISLATLIFLIVALSSVWVNSFGRFIAMRFITGIAAGVSSMVVPMYLAEVAPSEKRGGFVSVYELSIAIGILAAYVSGYWASLIEDWRSMYLVSALPAAMQLVFLFFLPESPKWLILSYGKKEGLPSKALFSPRFFRILIIGVVLSAFQQLTGFNVVLIFTPKIFCEAGFITRTHTTFVFIFIGLVHVIATLVSVFLIDSLGRRKLLIFSQGGVLATLVLLILSFSIDNLMLSVASIISMVAFLLHRDWAYCLGSYFRNFPFTC